MSIYDDLFSQDTGQNHGSGGVMTAIVKENWDEQHKGYVKVEYFFGEEGTVQTEWAQVASPYTGSSAGIYFLPEIGNEVVVAFVNGNRNEPIIIGSLWNAITPLGETMATEKNTTKILHTAKGHQVHFDETEGKEQVTIQTPGKLKINMSDESKSVTISNEEADSSMTIDFQNGKITVDAKNTIALAIGGTELITMDSQGVTVSADSITLDGSQSVSMKGQSTNIEGGSVNVKSDAALEVKAGATLKLEGSAMAEVKGGMVKIN